METGDGESPEENPQSRKGACDTHGWEQFEIRNNKIESLSDSIMDDSPTIKLLGYAMWWNKNGESDWQHSFGSEELTTSTYVRECNIGHGHDRTNMKMSQKPQGW